jgi:hypothetical protein
METSRVKFVVQNEARYSNFADQERGRYYRGKEGSVAYGAVAGRGKVMVVYSLAFLLFKLQGSYVKSLRAVAFTIHLNILFCPKI